MSDLSHPQDADDESGDASVVSTRSSGPTAEQGHGLPESDRTWVEPGMLYVVSTPIGNLADLSARALSVLQNADLIACEDTRHARKLLDHFGIRSPVISVHEHNEASRSVQIVEKLAQGQAVALISDAGTPAISDPGTLLVRQVRDAGHPVVPVPGASAVISALSASGLDSRHFWFEGFLPPKATARQKRLTALADISVTLAFYEAPHRIGAMLRDLQTVLGGQRRAVVARELTKRFEQIVGGSLDELLEQLNRDVIPARGEFVVLVEGRAEQASENAVAMELGSLIDALLAEGVAAKTVAKALSHVFSYPRNQLYQEVQSRKQDTE